MRIQTREIATVPVVLLLALLVCFPRFAAAETPTGALENISAGGTVTGWAADPDSLDAEIVVHFYLDGAAGGTGQLIGAATAGIPRTDIPFQGSHGFMFVIPPQYRDGRSHTLTAYGIDTSGRDSDNVVLSGSPFTFRLDPVPYSLPVIGTLETITSDGFAIGWALDPDAVLKSIDVHFYVGTAGNEEFAGSTTASIPRDDLLFPGAHGFRFPVPSAYRDGTPHRLSVRAVTPFGPILPGSQMFALNSTIVRLGNGRIDVGLEPRCGGTIVEILLQGRNVVNNGDCTGRQIQASLYDGNDDYDPCAACTGVWGWNPVQGGDRHNFGSPVLEMSVDSTSAYVRTQPYEWNPDDKGGGPGRPVLSDVLIEQWISFVPESPNTIHLRYRITHLGSDAHGNAEQEVPAVYTNLGYDRFTFYGGTRPWTNRGVTSRVFAPPPQSSRQFYVSENWSSLVDTKGEGLTVYIPQQYPYANGFRVPGTSGTHGFGTNYLRPDMRFTFWPGSVLEADVYLIAGNYRDARRTIYDLRTRLGAAPPDTMTPTGAVDQSTRDLALSGDFTITGWAFDNTKVSRVEILVDGEVVGVAKYGIRRNDIDSVYPRSPRDIGFSYVLNTRNHANGSHKLSVHASDEAGNVALVLEVWAQVTN